MSSQNTALKEVVYTPESELSHPRKMMRGMFLDLLAARELSIALFKRDIKAQFRQSILGYAWLFFPPIATTMVWFFLNTSGVVTVADTGIPYPAFVMIGTLLWQAFLDSLIKPIQSLNKSKAMLVKLNFPREALILSGIAETSVTSAVRFLLIIPILIFVDLNLSITAFFFPLGYLAMVAMGTAIGLSLTPIGLLFTDIGKGIQILGQFAMYATPVVYPIASEGALGWINRLNPITYVIETARSTLSGGPFPHLMTAVVVMVITMLLLLLSWLMFRITIPRVVERLGM